MGKAEVSAVVSGISYVEAREYLAASSKLARFQRSRARSKPWNPFSTTVAKQSETKILEFGSTVIFLSPSSRYRCNVSWQGFSKKLEVEKTKDKFYCEVNLQTHTHSLTQTKTHTRASLCEITASSLLFS